MRKIIYFLLLLMIISVFGFTKQMYGESDSNLDDGGNSNLDDGGNSNLIESNQDSCDDSSCLGEQICVEGECIELICGECQYLENNGCVDYNCCTNQDCDDSNPETEDMCQNQNTKFSSCKNTQLITGLCEDYYGGQICDGFCFADLTWQCEVEGGKRVKQQGDLTIEINFPQYVDANSEYTIKFDFNNNGATPTNYLISKIQTDGIGTIINQSYEIAAGESKEVLVEVLAPSNPGFQKNILLYQDNIQSIIYMHLIVLDPTQEILSCGDKKYNTDFAICKDETLYPTLFPSCYDDSDCTAYPGRDKCLANTCYERIGTYKNWEDKEYEVEVIPLYINVDGDESEPNKAIKKQEMDQRITDLNGWFINEKEFWNFNGNFNILWDSADYCTFDSLDEFVNLMEETQTEEGLYSAIRSMCGDLDKDMHGIYYIWSTGSPGSGPEFEGYNEARENYIQSGGLSIDNGKLFVFYSDFLILLHETLHGFGANDLYHYDTNFESTAYGQYYPWNDCQLYNQNPQSSLWEMDSKPHLCVLEAEAIGIAG